TPPERLAEGAQAHRLCLFDVRNEQAAFGGGGDTQVDVFLGDDLLRPIVETGVDGRIFAECDEHRLGDEGQRGEWQAGERGGRSQVLDRGHGRGAVDGEGGARLR